MEAIQLDKDLMQDTFTGFFQPQLHLLLICGTKAMCQEKAKHPMVQVCLTRKLLLRTNSA